MRALEGGADACLTEPLEPPVLIATVRALLRARQAEDALRDALAPRASGARRGRGGQPHQGRIPRDALARAALAARAPSSTGSPCCARAVLDAASACRTALEAIERNTRLQVKLIEDLLDVSRIISGKMRLEIGLVDLAQRRSAPRSNRVRAGGRGEGASISKRVSTRRSARVSGDAARLQQVVWNLLSNAVKFTPKGGQVEVRTGARRSRAEIEVSDTGRGIEPHFLPHLFERFRQADSSTTRSRGRPRARPRHRSPTRRAARRHGDGGQRRARAGRDVHGVLAAARVARELAARRDARLRIRKAWWESAQW